MCRELAPCYHRHMPIVVHHLMHSRSLRVLWLLEELGLEYELVRYERDASFRTPPSLEKAHPLGRAPVVEVDGLVLAESGAILDHFVDRERRLRPTSPEGLREYRFFLHYAEGSSLGCKQHADTVTHGSGPDTARRSIGLRRRR